MRLKLVYLISDIGRALAFEWIASGLDTARYDLRFILINPRNEVLANYLKERNIPVLSFACPGKKDWPRVWLQLRKYFKTEKPDIIHCHLQQATILGLSAAKATGIKRRIHTRHHSSLHHVYFPKGVFWDKLANRLSTQIVAISGTVKRILIDWEKVPETKIKLIPHGFLLDAFTHPDRNVVQELKVKYNLPDNVPVIGCISRFIELKGVHYLIPAFKELLKQYPEAILLLFNAEGDYVDQINALLADIPEANYRKIHFEPNITAAYQLMDICVHIPIADHLEAFGQIYIEALAAGIPLVCTLSGIANDIMVHKKNSWIVPYKEVAPVAEGMQAILSDKVLKEGLIKEGKETAKAFSLQHMIDNLENMYDEQ